MTNNITPLSDLKEQREARELAQSIKQSNALTYSLAWLLLRALAQIDALTVLADPTMRRFTQSNPCPYADLVRENLDHLWEGPGRNDFAAALIYSVQKYLGKRSLPREKGDAINAIRNKVLQEDWGWLEQRWDERHRPEATRTAVGSDALPEVLDESAVPAFGTPAYYEWLEQRKGGGD